jgi:hypothetical protein
MRALIGSMVMFLFIAVAGAQAVKPAAPPAMAQPDSVKAGKCPMMEHKTGMDMDKNEGCARMDRERRCCGREGEEGFMPQRPNRWGPMFRNGPQAMMCPMAKMHMHQMLVLRKLFRLMVLIILIVNILLTILVSLDMAKRGKFNGLWIPILLLVGIPGTVIYALFRIGDIFAEAKKN